MRLTRRTFIQASATTAGLLAAGCATTEPLSAAMAPRKAKDAGPAKGEWVASTCQGCTQWCAIQIFVQDGRAVRVRGNPLAKSNHGFVCPRGHMIPQQMYDPDRVKTPMKRTNAAKGRGIDPKFVPISWDEALDTVAKEFLKIKEELGSQAIGMAPEKIHVLGNAKYDGLAAKVSPALREETARRLHMAAGERILGYSRAEFAKQPDLVLTLLDESSRATLKSACRRLIGEVSADINPDKVKRVIACSGKVYYDLVKARAEKKHNDVAIFRVEQLYPFPHKALATELKHFVRATEIVWCQDEPANQGAWFYAQHHILENMTDGQKLGYAGRPPSASPAVGYYAKHNEQQKALLDAAFAKFKGVVLHK